MKEKGGRHQLQEQQQQQNVGSASNDFLPSGFFFQEHSRILFSTSTCITGT